jgi:nicotinic acid mononucleotide adenylyltransferase
VARLAGSSSRIGTLRSGAAQRCCRRAARFTRCAPGGWVRDHGPLLVAASSLPISASEIRRRAREGRSLAYRLPDSVVGYIREHHLYRSEHR